jgi:N-acetylneuraminic acid mutarotase
MPSTRINAGVAAVNGILYVIGGAKDQTLQGLPTVDAYDPIKDTWTTKAPLPTPRYGAGIGVINGSIYVIGGSQKVDSYTGAFEIYSPLTNKWTTKTPIPTPKKGVVTAVMNNLLYVLGDFASFTASSADSAPGMEVYDPATDTWTQKAAIPTPRSNFSVGVVNNLLYAFGGTADGLLTTTEVYDSQSNTWASKAPLPAPRKGFAVGVINGVLYVAGGSNESGLVAPTYSYDPMHDSWSSSLTIPLPADLVGGAATEEGVFYVVGGIQAGGKVLTSVQAFSPSGPRFYVHKYQ